MSRGQGTNDDNKSPFGPARKFFLFFLSHFICLLITLLIISVTTQPVSLCLQSGSMTGKGAKSPLSRFSFLLMYIML
jgi:hypothetical protein